MDPRVKPEDEEGVKQIIRRGESLSIMKNYIIK